MRKRPRHRIGICIAALTVVLVGCGVQTTGHVETGPSATAKTDPAIAAMVPANLKEKGTLAIATNAPNAPLEFFDDDNKTLIGFDVDIGNALGSVMGMKIDWENSSFDGIMPGLASGRYDLGMAGFSIKPERLEVVDFVSHYFSGGGFLIRKGSGVAATDFNDSLCGYRVAVKKGASQLEKLDEAQQHCQAEGKPPINILQIPDQNIVALTLTSDRADVVAADKMQVERAAGQSDGAICVSGTYRSPHSLAGVAIPKRLSGLSETLRAAMDKLIETGEYQRISDKWGVNAGAINKSDVYTKPDQVAQGGDVQLGPPAEGCA